MHEYICLKLSKPLDNIPIDIPLYYLIKIYQNNSNIKTYLREHNK